MKVKKMPLGGGPSGGATAAAVKSKLRPQDNISPNFCQETLRRIASAASQIGAPAHLVEAVAVASGAAVGDVLYLVPRSDYSRAWLSRWALAATRPMDRAAQLAGWPGGVVVARALPDGDGEEVAAIGL